VSESPIITPSRRIAQGPGQRRQRVDDSQAKARQRRRLFQYFLENGFQDDDELAFFLDEFLGLTYARTAACPHHVPPFQILADLYFDRVRAMLVYASRASGKTLTFAVQNLLDGAFRPEAIDITNAAATKDQAVNCSRSCLGRRLSPRRSSRLSRDLRPSFSEVAADGAGGSGVPVRLRGQTRLGVPR
jgi:hypothetical protein